MTQHTGLLLDSRSHYPMLYSAHASLMTVEAFMYRRIFKLSIVSLAVAILFASGLVPFSRNAGLTSSASAFTARYDIGIISTGFSPQNITVPRMSLIVWMNSDTVNHTVTASAAAGPQSQAIPPGKSYSFAMNNLGVFAYKDTFNPSLRGQINVVVIGDPLITSPSGPGSTTPPASSSSSNPKTTVSAAPADAATASGSVAAGIEPAAWKQNIPLLITGFVVIAGAGSMLIIRRNASTGS
jgi:plastocyanin